MSDVSKNYFALMVGFGIIAIIVIVISIVFGIEAHKAKTETIITKNNLKKSNKTLTSLQNQITALTGTQRASQEMLNINKGQRGPPGLQGPSGGIYQDKGYLHNIKYGPNMVVDRYFSNGINSKLFINTKTFGATSQNWTFTNDGVLENKYGGCPVGNSTTQEVYMMDNCKDGTGKGQWIVDNKGGKLRWKQNPHFCLAVGGKTRSTAHTIKNGKPVSGQTQYATLKLEKCDENNPDNQVWTFS